MIAVGQSAAEKSLPSAATLEQLRQFGNEEPLSPTPLLVNGAIADQRNDLSRAEKLLLEAQRRDPRSSAARYLLADIFLRTGRTTQGVTEMADLSRILPASSVQLIPALAQFAQSPDAANQLRRIFAANPKLEQPVLLTLAADPSNGPLILSVASPATPGEPPPAWQSQLLIALVQRGEYAKAYSMWSKIVGIHGGPAAGIFNPAYMPLAAPAPFNWSYDLTNSGLVQAEGGRLAVLYYGRQLAVLAEQVLLLPPGQYRLSIPVSVTIATPGTVAWSVTCLPSAATIATIPIPTQGSATLKSDFKVPDRGCAAQQLELDGLPQEGAVTANMRFSALGLERTGN